MSSSVAQLLLAEDDQPTDDEVKAYAAFLGVDLDRFPELRGLVLDGLTAPLPHGWTVTVVESGEGQGTFYQHTTSGMWLDEHPYDKVFRRRAQLRMQELSATSSADDGAVPPPALGGVAPPVFGSCRQVTVTADVEPLSDDDEWGGFAGTGVPRSAPLAPSHIARLEREFVYDVLQQQQPGQGDVDRDTAAPPHATETVAPAPLLMAAPPALPAILLVDSALSSDASPSQADGSAQPPPPSARSLRRVTNNAPTTAPADSQPSAASSSTGAVPPPPAASLRPKTKLPAEFVCPITADIMRDPVVIADGFSYEREAIQRWFAKHDTSPITGAVLINRAVFPNTTLRVHIAEFMQSYEIDEEA